MATNNKSIQIIIAAETAKFQKGINDALNGVSRLEKGSKSLSASIDRSFSAIRGRMASVFAVGAIGIYANSVRKIADEYTNLEARLKLATSSEGELKTVEAALYAAAQQTGTAYSDNANSFAKLALSLKNYGAASSEILTINELVNKSLIVSGSSSAEASSFMLQFGQAMGSGVLQGDEFRGMMESNSYFAQQLAKALNTDIAGLRRMSKEGKLTTDVLRAAFPKMGQEINDAFAKIPATTARAMTALDNAYKRIISESNKASNGTGTIAAEILKLAQTIDTNRAGIISFFSAMIAGATKVVSAVANIGQSFAGWAAVSDGDLSVFKFATMNAEELNGWLKKNVAEVERQKTAEAARDAALASDIIKIRAMKDAQNGVTTAVTATSTAIKQAQGEALDAMKKKYQDYAAEVRRLQDQIAGREQSLADQLRTMARTGMSDINAWNDLKKDADEYAAAAKTAADAGDFTTAVAAADKAKEKYAQLNTEVKNGDQVLVSQTEALKVAMDGVKEAGRIGIEALKGQQAAAKAAMDELKNKSGFADLSAGMDEAEKQWLDNWEKMKAGSMDQIAAVEQRIVELTKDRYITVYVNEVVKKATGGLIQKLARGGRLAGYGGGDRISALLEAGEFVIRKEAVAKFGSGMFAALNSLRMPAIPRFAVGGMVGGSSASGDTVTVNMNFGPGRTVPVTASRVGARQLLSELERMQRLAS